MLDLNESYIGYSDKIHDPAVQAALKKNKAAAFIFFILLILAPIVISIIISIKNDDNSVIAVGFGVSAVFFVFNAVYFLIGKTKRQWDGTVVKKYTERKHSSGDNDTRLTYYVVELRTDSGQKKKISGTINPWYDYLHEGDKVRYYPQFNNYYEKYDKSNDSYVYCPVCMSKNSINDEFCKRCKVPVIK